MTEPGFNAEASLYPTTQHYRFAGLDTAGRHGSVLAQSLFCARLGQRCGGIDLTCCPGLRCTAQPGGLGICVPGIFHCSPCIHGRQFCCPPPGFGAPCFVRSCITPL
jgi:hypothetical protein